MDTQPENMAAEALDTLPVAVLLVDASGRLRARNRAAIRMLPAGATLVEALPCLLADRSVDWPAELERLRDAGKLRTHNNLKLPAGDGSARLVDVSLAPLESDPATLVVMVEDVTARAGMERRLAMSERLAAVGKLAAQVAHELNNPLDGILRYRGLAERVSESGQTRKVSQYLGEARAGLTRMARIISQLLDYSRLAGRRGERMPLNSLVNQASEAMSPSLQAAGVSVVCDLADDDACMVPGSFFQVLCNLMKNGADAMPGGGLLVVTVRQQGSEASVRVTDTGSGIPPEILDRIFEPFFSTKTGDHGTGLGLSICRDIVERSGGTIAAANRPQGGAVFTVTLPCIGEWTAFEQQ
jgi:signal transduction histidine kinase